MQEQVLVSLTVSRLLEETRAAALDLDTAAGLVLDVLDVGAAMANHLGTKVEARNRLEVDGDLRLGPFTLPNVSFLQYFRRAWRYKYPSKFVALVVVRLPATETAFVHQLRKLLFLQLLNHGNGLFEAILAGTGDVQVKRGVLGVCMLMLVGVYRRMV